MTIIGCILGREIRRFVKEKWMHIGFLVYMHFWVVAHTFPLSQPDQSFMQHLKNATFALGTPTMLGLSIGAVLEGCALLADRLFYLDPTLRQQVAEAQVTLTFAAFVYFVGVPMHVVSVAFRDFLWMTALGMAHGKFAAYTVSSFPKSSMLLQCFACFINLFVFVVVLSNIFPEILFVIFQCISPIVIIISTFVYEHKTQKSTRDAGRKRAAEQVRETERIRTLWNQSLESGVHYSENAQRVDASFSNPTFLLEDER
ncbi:hypothetical protein CAEBREN_11753 [Caenorhabditis brenneri]|uniref:Uncharacterized protein n=1 Tax=Caenorhabditis brenneri TaxID=135651 RepID=G0P992_CAEBE|nr:hypothetical protein CAEBREN_11753 [Caenorhabditis brenneri]